MPAQGTTHGAPSSPLVWIFVDARDLVNDATLTAVHDAFQDHGLDVPVVGMSWGRAGAQSRSMVVLNADISAAQAA